MFKSAVEGVDRSFPDDRQSPRLQTLGHFIAICRAFAHHGQKAQVENPPKQLAAATSRICHAPQHTERNLVVQGKCGGWMSGELMSAGPPRAAKERGCETLPTGERLTVPYADSYRHGSTCPGTGPIRHREPVGHCQSLSIRQSGPRSGPSIAPRFMMSIGDSP